MEIIEHLKLPSARKIYTLNDSTYLIDNISNWCFIFAGLLFFLEIIQGISKISIIDIGNIIGIGLGLKKYKSRELAFVLCLYGVIAFIQDIIVQHFGSLVSCFLLLLGIKALRATNAYYYFNKATFSVKNFIIKSFITIIFFVICWLTLGIMFLYWGLPISKQTFIHLFTTLGEILFVLIFFCGYSGKLAITENFRIVSFKEIES